VVRPIGMVCLEFNGSGANEIKRHLEVETLLMTRDNRPELMNKVLNRLMQNCSPLTAEDSGEGGISPPRVRCHCERPARQGLAGGSAAIPSPSTGVPSPLNGED
jgi:hypothetical protein